MARRLPVLQNQAPEDEAAAARPRWHWALIGGGLIFTMWIPLAIVAEWIARVLSASLVDVADPQALARFSREASPSQRAVLVAAVVGPVALSFVLACLAGGALVGRFGGRAGAREAALGGVVAALASWLVAAFAGALSPWLLALAAFVVLAVTGGLIAGAGGRIGAARRPSI